MYVQQVIGACDLEIYLSQRITSFSPHRQDLIDTPPSLSLLSLSISIFDIPVREPSETFPFKPLSSSMLLLSQGKSPEGTSRAPP
jgi:hypothetical protein